MIVFDCNTELPLLERIELGGEVFRGQPSTFNTLILKGMILYNSEMILRSSFSCFHDFKGQFLQ